MTAQILPDNPSCCFVPSYDVETDIRQIHIVIKGLAGHVPTVLIALNPDDALVIANKLDRCLGLDQEVRTTMAAASMRVEEDDSACGACIEAQGAALKLLVALATFMIHVRRDEGVARMTTRTAAGMPLGIPSERDATLADRAGRVLEALIDGTQPVSARFGDETVDLPAPALRLLREILDRMAHGKGVVLTPLQAELTMCQAAELLQVSRPHLVQLLDEGRISCRKVGSHRRVRAEDILACRRETEFCRREALDELTARDQKLGLQ